LFSYYDGEHVASFDWLGGQLVAAVAELGAGAWIYALLAALPMVAIAAYVGRRLSARWAVVAILIFAFSPMVFAMSMTTHAHLVSRGLIGVGFAALGWGFWSLERGARTPGWLWGVAGFVLALSLITRPFETGSLSFPLLVWFLWRAVRDPAARKP